MKRFIVILVLILTTATGVAAKNNGTDTELKDSGYVGTLPDVTKTFQSAEPAEGLPLFEALPGFDDASELKPVPRDNPAFVNIILKRDKTSQYINDINAIIGTVERVADSIEDGENVQLFAAKVDYLDKNTDYIRRKYSERSESQYLSYKKLMEFTMHAKAVSMLRSEAQLYSPYLAYSDEGFIYNPNNIELQLSYLLEEVKETVLILKDAN